MRFTNDQQRRNPQHAPLTQPDPTQSTTSDMPETRSEDKS